MNDPAPTDAKAKRPVVSMCVTRDEIYILKPQKAETPPERILLPWVHTSDLRLFVRYGELLKAFDIIEFAFVRIEECPELPHDRACYKELVRKEFDPTGCAQVRQFDLDKYEKTLNEAQELVETRLPDTPAQDAA
jgi:hypothetical protein